MGDGGSEGSCATDGEDLLMMEISCGDSYRKSLWMRIAMNEHRQLMSTSVYAGLEKTIPLRGQLPVDAARLI